jgi:hypothetical protein
MPEEDIYFTPFFTEGFQSVLGKTGMLDHTIMGGAHHRATMRYIQDRQLPLDEGGHNGPYDLVLTCTDLIVQRSIRNSRIVLVQEGITEPEGLAYRLVKDLGFPRVLANTAATGLSNAYDVFCVASPGYRSLFIQKGVNPDKIVVTGIPNFDRADGYRHNTFPYKHFVLVATSSIRETFGLDDRIGFLKKAKRITGKKKVIFKLHPNEDHGRAEQEIRSVFPGALIFREGNLHEMIANCDVLVAQNTSAIYTAAALGKKVYSSVPERKIRELMPLQNGGTSAIRIAEVCRDLLNTPPVPDQQFSKPTGRSLLPDWFGGI